MNFQVFFIAKEGNEYRLPDAENFYNFLLEHNLSNLKFNNLPIYINAKGKLKPEVFETLIKNFIKKYSPHDFYTIYIEKKGNNLQQNRYDWIDNIFHEKKILLKKEFGSNYWKKFVTGDLSCYIAYSEKTNDEFDCFMINIETKEKINKDELTFGSFESHDNSFEVYGDTKTNELFIKDFLNFDRIYLLDNNKRHIKNISKFAELDFPNSVKNIILSVKLDE